MIWFLKHFRAYRELAEAKDYLQGQCDVLTGVRGDNTRLSVEIAKLRTGFSISEGRLQEISIERNAYRGRATEWENRYIALQEEHAKALKQSADWIATRTSGSTMYATMPIAPPPAIDYSKLPMGRRLARDVVRDETDRRAREILGTIKLRAEAESGADDMVEKFRREQEKYLAMQATVPNENPIAQNLTQGVER